MSFIAELKRRNVFKVGIAYVVASWLLLQLTEVLTELLEIGPEVGKIVIVLLIVGFVPALIFAWAFEMTPEGIKRDHEVDRDHSIAPQTGQKLNFAIIGMLVLVAGYFIWESRFSEKPQPLPVTANEAERDSDIETGIATLEPSIAVLPFVNMSADPEQEFFSDGISEELLNLLVRVDGLKVASRTSSFSFKGANPNIPQIASELKVDHILEGSVRKSGNRIRITAQLIETNNDRHLWSDTFDRELDDIFVIQDEIANAIVAALKDELGVGLGTVEVTAATENLDAYQSYLKARELFYARRQLPMSASLFRQAIELDSGFAKAWEGLGAVHSVSVAWLAGDGIDHGALAIEASLMALELDPALSMPYAVLGMREDLHEGSHYIQAMDNLNKAVENDPKNATAWHWRGILNFQLGFLDQSIRDQDKCLELDPGYLNCMQHLASVLLNDGQTERALILFEETVKENYHSTSEVFVPHYLQQGQRITAYLLASATIDRAGMNAPIKAWIEALENPNANKAQAAQILRDWAEKAGISCSILLAPIVSLEMWDCIDLGANVEVVWFVDAAEYRKTRHFKQQMSQYHLPYWQERGFPPQCRAVGEEDFECD